MRFLGLVLATTLVYAGCSTPDPGAVTYNDERKPAGLNGGAAGGGAGGAGAGSAGNAGGAGAGSPGAGSAGTPGGGADGGSAGGGDGGGGAQGVFTGAFAANKPGQSARTAHQGKAGAPAQAGRGDDCLTCHRTGGTAPAFMFGGTVFADTAGQTPAVDVEVGVLLPNGTRVKANSDDNGNFWLPDAQALPAGSKTAGRNTATTANMLGAISTGGCNGNTCHGNGGLVLHVP